ncbi:hypothetical protein HY967_00935 [Candidatus Jorgensenbacteria bacterium]|nr:hypothetical protein [Candidatus Jorgensenbacteria bacterium]
MFVRLRWFLLVLFAINVFIVKQALAYTVDTHAYLTEVIFNFYNQKVQRNKIPQNLKDFLIDGARQEDDSPRWMNHFYDPIYDRGLSNSSLGNWHKSKEWAQNSQYQSKIIYRGSDNIASILTAVQQEKLNNLDNEADFTWRRALDYWSNHEKEKAVFVLGHILHLIEDASVPDHTRNDSHPGDSPYENWTARFTLTKRDKDLSERLQDKEAVVLDDLDKYFNSMAQYSNNNFYSKDSIGFDSGYDLPNIDYFAFGLDGNQYGMKIDSEFGDYKLIKSPAIILGLNWDKAEYFKSDLLLNDYWSRLSTKAVQYGAGVIKLFFDEVAKAENASNQGSLLTANFIETFEKTISSLADALISYPKANISAHDHIFDEAQDVIDHLSLDVTDQEGFSSVVEEAAASLQQVSVTQNELSPEVLERLTAIINQLNQLVDSLRSLPVKVDLVTVSDHPPVFTGGGLPPQDNSAPSSINSTDSDQDLLSISPSPSPSSDSSIPDNNMDFDVAFDLSTMELVFNWDGIETIFSTNTQLTYEISEIVGSSSVIWFSSTSTVGFRQVIDEVGRSYGFVFKVYDVGGAELVSRTVDINIPSFLDGLYFYLDPRSSSTKYVVDMHYGQYPFVPDPYWNTVNDSWKVLVFYLNQDAVKEKILFGHLGSWDPSDIGGVLAIQHPRCSGFGSSPGNILILADTNERCSSVGGGIYTLAMSPGEDKHLILEAVIQESDRVLTQYDYVTAAFYSLLQSGPGMSFKLVAVDRVHHQFQDAAPPHQSPQFSGEVGVAFDRSSSLVSFSWPMATDLDTNDSSIFYDVNFSRSSTTGEFDSSTWQFAGSGLEYQRIVREGDNIDFAVRARDDFGNTSSDTLTASWIYPINKFSIIQSESNGWSGSIGTVSQNVYDPDSASFQNFSPTEDLSFNQIMLRLRHESGGDQTVLRLAVYADSDSNEPDFNQLLGTALFDTGWDNTYPAPDQDISFLFPVPISVSTGNRYWLVLDVASYFIPRGYFRNEWRNAVYKGDDMYTNGEAGYGIAQGLSGSCGCGFGGLYSDGPVDWYMKIGIVD